MVTWHRYISLLLISHIVYFVCVYSIEVCTVSSSCIILCCMKRIKSCRQSTTTASAKPVIDKHDKHFPHMKQCNTAEKDWSLILSEKSLFSLYLGTCCLCHLTKFCQKSINRSSSVQLQPLSSLYVTGFEKTRLPRTITNI